MAKEKKAGVPHLSGTRSERPDDLWHIDLCGPMKASLGGSFFIIIIVDSSSRWMKLYGMRRKSDTLASVNKFLADVSGTGVPRSFRMNNGGEFISRDFIAFCDNAGIGRTYTVLGTPQQNGPAESAIWRVNKAGHATRLKARRLFPKINFTRVPGFGRDGERLWLESCHWAAGGFNRSPTKANVGNKSPHELFTGRPPPLQIVPFLQPGYMRVTRVRKIDPQAALCCYLNNGDNHHESAVKALPATSTPPSPAAPSIAATPPPLVAAPPATPHAASPPVTAPPATPLAAAPPFTTTAPPATPLAAAPPFTTTAPPATPFAVAPPGAAPSTNMPPLTTRTIRELDVGRGDMSVSGRTRAATKDQGGGRASSMPPLSARANRELDLGQETRVPGRLRGRGVRFQDEGAEQSTSHGGSGDAPAHRFGLVSLQDKATLLSTLTTRSVVDGGRNEIPSSAGGQSVVKAKWVLNWKSDEHGWPTSVKPRLVARGNMQRVHVDCGETYAPTAAVSSVRLLAAMACEHLSPRHFDIKQAFVQSDLDEDVFMRLSKGCVWWIVRDLNTMVPVKNLGGLRWYSGCFYERDWDAGTLKISQQTYAEELGMEFGVEYGKEIPLPVRLKLSEFDQDEEVVSWPFRKLIRSLTWLATQTRPDIANAVSAVARYCASPKEVRWREGLGILGYVVRTSDLGITFRRGSVAGLSMEVFADADYAKAEYVSLADVMKELLLLRQVRRFMLPEAGMPCIPVFEDNQGAIQLAQKPISNSSNSKHIDVRHHFIRELVGRKEISIFNVKSAYQHADFLTKALNVGD
ncbi:unnamed protein product [Ectocarpus sp. CCAP 1310/34]|nr:unnamed protein product [Ectocarpus sp. CCAP 1310/34]